MEYPVLQVVTVEKLNAISMVLEAFGNSRTVLNTNATRFTQIFSLDYDQSGQIASASVQVCLLHWFHFVIIGLRLVLFNVVFTVLMQFPSLDLAGRLSLKLAIFYISDFEQYFKVGHVHFYVLSSLSST
jgi:hypothetical protein